MARLSHIRSAVKGRLVHGPAEKGGITNAIFQIRRGKVYRKHGHSMSNEPAISLKRLTGPTPGARERIKEQVANELVFAVVGHVGSGTSTITRKLKELLANDQLPGGPYDVTVLKARHEIIKWSKDQGQGQDVTEPAEPDLQFAVRLQDLGDAMRKDDPAAVARALILHIREIRAGKQGIGTPSGAVKPDGQRRAYVIDALRHPAEAHLLRSVYRNAFALIGVVCEESVREQRLVGKKSKYKDAGGLSIEKFMERDAKAKEKYGQRVSDTFHLSDYFLDNSENRFLDGSTSNEDWDILRQLKRLISLITHSEVIRPGLHETAMYTAYGAQMRSACLSRQVGAALVDAKGNIAATGSNEVPQAGGGVYGQSVVRRSLENQDHRCAYRKRRDNEPPYCSNTREQNTIIDDLLREIPQLKSIDGEARDALRELLRKSRIGGLIEFSRAVHAEMDALLSAGRQGVSTVGGRLFVTTFPCHYCARHIVAAGVDEVQYIEPYPKSKALALHDDSITTSALKWVPPSALADLESDPETSAEPIKRGLGKSMERKVLFRPFTGVAPRMYARAFLKDRELKNERTGMMEFGEPDWESAWDISKGSYAELEAVLLQEAEGAHD
jgi:deoxycytidylate deaminase